MSKRLVRDGLADPTILERSPRRSENDELITLIAALSRSPETRTLEAIAAALTDMHVPTPRGRLKWPVSSVKHLLDQARDRKNTCLNSSQSCAVRTPSSALKKKSLS